MGSAVDSAFDFVGDVAGGIGDVVGNVAETAWDYAPEIAAVLAAYYGNPALAAETFGSSTAAEIAAAEAASAAAASGATASGIGSLSNFLPGTTGGGYTGGMIGTGIEGLDSALNLAKSGYNLYSLYNQPQTISQQYNKIQPLTVQQTSGGDTVDPTKFSQGLQYATFANTPELSDITNILMNPIYKVGDALSSIGASDIADAVKKYGPTIISVIGGKLSYDDQKRINDIIMGAYNKYNVGTELKKLQYRTGQGLPSLPIYRSGLPMGSQTTATAPARTSADIVYKPVAKAKGGLMNIMDHEMDLRAKGGFVPIGKKERADDVPARLSLNEFVMTAKAVRNAGKGSVNKGAKKMYSLMKRLEKGASL